MRAPGAGAGRKHERVRSVLVVTEVALACMLLVGAGLLLRSFLQCAGCGSWVPAGARSGDEGGLRRQRPGYKTGDLSAAEASE